jgi:hypothetical protein
LVRLAELVCFGMFRPACWFRIKTAAAFYRNRRKITVRKYLDMPTLEFSHWESTRRAGQQLDGLGEI